MSRNDEIKLLLLNTRLLALENFLRKKFPGCEKELAEEFEKEYEIAKKEIKNKIEKQKAYPDNGGFDPGDNPEVYFNLF